MEGIVVGIAQINFHQNLLEMRNENGPPHFIKTPSATICDRKSPTTEEPLNVRDQGIDNSTLNNLSEFESINDSGWEEIEDDLEKNSQNKKCYTFAERRQMPTRLAKESSLLGIKRRTIIKPTKRTKTHEDFQNLKPSVIKKIYLNKKMTKFKPSSLETIFEEKTTFCNNEQECTLMGGRKIKRSLSFSDGLRCGKTLLNKRRAKIKKTFGKRFALKKISLEEFIKKLNSSIDTNENALNNDCQMGDDKSEIVQEILHSEMLASEGEIGQEISRSEMLASNVSECDVGQEISHSEMIPSNASENLQDIKNLPPTGLPYAFKSTMSL